jgi:hypothetical protein
MRIDLTGEGATHVDDVGEEVVAGGEGGEHGADLGRSWVGWHGYRDTEGGDASYGGGCWLLDRMEWP